MNYHLFLRKSLVLTLLSVGILFNSCQSNNSSVKIGILISNLQSDYHKKVRDYFESKVKELGGEPLICSAEFDDKLQISQAQKCMDEGAKVLVVNPANLTTAAEIVRIAHHRKVKVIAFDGLILNCDLDYNMSFDVEMIGKLMAEYAVKIKPEGKYILLGGDKTGLNALLIKKGEMDVLKPYLESGKIQLLMNIFIEDWAQENVTHELKRYLDLTGNPPDVIIAANDGMSIGAIDALKEYGLEGKVIVTGQDARLESCRYLLKGYQTMTVYKSVKQIVFKTAEVAFKMAKNENILSNGVMNNGLKDIPTIFISPVSVDKNNIKSVVIADGFFKEEDLYRP